MKIQSKKFSLFCWNIANPSIERAGQQAYWLRKRPEDVFVLSEAKKSEGCLFLERYFQAYGFNVFFPKPEDNEFATMIVSKLPLVKSKFTDSIDFLNSRVAAIQLSLPNSKLEVIGMYVPSRNSDYEKIQKKKRFLQILEGTLKLSPNKHQRIFCGDFNVLEPEHVPHYPFFEEWEYNFYRNLFKHGLCDAFRHLNPKIYEYSWVGRTGDGYRYDHCFVSENLLPLLKNCYYFHGPRQSNPKLSDHSALILELSA